MGRINGWRRMKHHASLEDEAVQRTIEARGRAIIAAWRHTELHTRLVHIYEPSAERPFTVELEDDSISAPEEGHYSYRTDGGTATKALMRRYP